ncbi:hypothetical protein LCH15_03795 [Comamonas thiooxydans]|nr:hypothetical protein [Comamonas thiooxydans]MCO8247558.1 hypothetical protein [Comamonas thiooxydans]UBQ42639.1 hypothetical protein LCH15_03795 [Comamonas thiooxydans]
MSSWQQRGWRLLGGLLLVAGLAACGAPPSAQDVLQVAESASAAPRTPRVESTLGTQWGEGRESVTRTVEAARLDPERPRTVAQLRYSDEASIRRALGRSIDQQLSVQLADGDVEWVVQDGQGRSLPIYTMRGARDYQLAGRHGERYELVYSNRSQRHYEVVVTVDGLDVLTGQAGSVRNAGYLLRPGETLRIEGFRKSQREVAAFRFSGKERAYAGNTPAGDARNVGVIGAALFEVRLQGRDAARPAPEPRGAAEPAAFPADGRYAPPPQYRR